jgi:xylulose-5-phosphate/fructose-6-phosphate phosphoketolase
MVDKRAEDHAYVRRTCEDLPEVRDWACPAT